MLKCQIGNMSTHTQLGKSEISIRTFFRKNILLLYYSQIGNRLLRYDVLAERSCVSTHVFN